MLRIHVLPITVLLALPASRAVANTEQPWEEFSGAKALQHIQELVDLGPRPAGSKAIEKCRGHIENYLTSCGWKVSRQSFTQETPRGQIPFVNILARFPGSGRGNEKQAAAPSFLLCSHYDTKLFETFRFVGANDGGSSTALLLEMARVLGRYPALARKIELAFFDGEEAFENFSETDGLYGSRYFAKSLQEAKSSNPFHGGILFDMVGDRSLTITLPPDSPSQIARDIFAAAEALNLRSYFSYFDRDITDDHTPLNRIGIPTIDLIDFDFPQWHTAEDTVDHVSGESLAKVGRVALFYLSQFALR
jgi:glutaminyl-peptide cyclotransferase